ncbi:MAG: NADH-quinone oxidoreductase subunit L [Bacteroidia bacterium]
MTQLAWLIPFFPLLGFLITGFGKNVLPKTAAGYLASLMVLASFIISCGIFLSFDGKATTVNLFDWINSGTLNVSFSFLIDQLSLVMLLIVTGVGFLIHIYSIGYMHDDPAFTRFFSYLNLFIFFMLLLVLGSNYIVLFTGWEGVGLCSYLLIGFWFKNTEYNHAANKAFIMNRIGDLGFLLGIILIYITFGSTSFDTIFPLAGAFPVNQPVIIAITLLLFVGAMGKSAQIPLYTWLPDAMAGPTPVSALIHAATMVTAGIYMVIRSNVLYTLAPFTLSIITMIGAATAIFSAAIALTQTDIKKVLAYSTVSQLGYMFVALGVGAYSTALFHVTTHAFFKALLFLAAGSVIHAMGGEQDIRKMGGLKGKLKITYFVFMIGTLAIIGLPPFAAFFSKDEILAKVWMENSVAFVVLAITSVLTAIYMLRLFYLTFFGKFRGTHDQEHHLHESPAVMTTPLMILAVLSAVGGLLGVPEIFGGKHLLNEFLAPVVTFPRGEASHTFEIALMATSVVVLVLLMAVLNKRYSGGHVPPATDAQRSALERASYHKFYIDELYNAIIVRPLHILSEMFYKVVDVKVIDGLVNSINKIVTGGSRTLRLAQDGNVGFYIFAMVFGIIAILFFNLLM